MALYWHGGSGNWSDYTNHWSNNSGNSPASPAAAAPTSTDDVIFDVNSHSAAYTVTVDATANCRDMTWANPASGSPTLTASTSQTLNIYGSAVYVYGMTVSGDGLAITYKATSGTKTVTSNAVVFGSRTIFSGPGGTFQLVDDYSSTNNTSQVWVVTAGTIDPNGKTVTFSGTSTFITTNATAPFYNLVRTGAAIKTGLMTLYSNITVTNSLKILGNSAVNRPLATSDTIGTPRVITLTAGAAGFDSTSGNFDLRDIQFNTGGENLDLSGLSGGTVGGGVVSGAGMSGGGTLTVTPAITAYWKSTTSGSKAFSLPAWYTETNGGGSAARVPLMQDTARFDSNSIGAASTVLVQDMPRIGSIDFTGVGNSPEFTTSATASVFGGITLISGMTLTASTQTYTFEGRGSYGLTSAGKVWGKPLLVNAPSGTLTLQDALIGVERVETVNGTFNDNNQNVTLLWFRGNNSVSATLTMGSGTWIFTGQSSNYAWYAPTSGLVINISTGTIKLTDATANTKYFAGAGKPYNNLWFAPGSGTGEFQITGSNTFAQLKDDGTANHSIKFTKSTTQTIADWQIGTASSRAGNTNVITLDTVDGAGTFAVAKSGGGKVSADYLNIQRSVATPAATFYAGTHSTNNNGAGSGWTFTAPPPIPVAPVSPISAKQSSLVSLTVNGTYFQTDATLALSGTGITVTGYTTRTTGQIVASLTIAGDATISSRNVTVTNGDAQSAALASAFAVINAPPGTAYIGGGTLAMRPLRPGMMR